MDKTRRSLLKNIRVCDLEAYFYVDKSTGLFRGNKRSAPTISKIRRIFLERYDFRDKNWVKKEVYGESHWASLE